MRKLTKQTIHKQNEECILYTCCMNMIMYILYGASAATHLSKFSLFYEILTRFYSKLAQNKPSKVHKSLKITKKSKNFVQKICIFYKKKTLL